jgi:hypothetical protein
MSRPPAQDVDPEQVPSNPHRSDDDPEQNRDYEPENDQATNVRGYRLFLFLTPM